jgi:hypothetical protein
VVIPPYIVGGGGLRRVRSFYGDLQVRSGKRACWGVIGKVIEIPKPSGGGGGTCGPDHEERPGRKGREILEMGSTRVGMKVF